MFVSVVLWSGAFTPDDHSSFYLVPGVVPKKHRHTLGQNFLSECMWFHKLLLFALSNMNNFKKKKSSNHGWIRKKSKVNSGKILTLFGKYTSTHRVLLTLAYLHTYCYIYQIGLEYFLNLHPRVNSHTMWYYWIFFEKC